jgi:hypothetical protein
VTSSRYGFLLGVPVLGLGIGLAYGLWQVRSGCGDWYHRGCPVMRPQAPGLLTCHIRYENISPIFHVYRTGGIGLLAGMAFALFRAWLARRNQARDRRVLQDDGRADQRLLR